MSELNQIEQETTGFRLKFTNLRKQFFPGPLEISDYFNFKIGDIIRKGRSGTIYKVVGIYRDKMHEYQYKIFTNSKTPKDQRFIDLLEHYKKAGNFGVCSIKVIPIMKGSKVIEAKRTMTFSELYNVNINSYVRFVHYDILSQINSVDNVISMSQYRMATLSNKINSDLNKKQALQDLYNQHILKEEEIVQPIVIDDEVEDVNNENPH